MFLEFWIGYIKSAIYWPGNRTVNPRILCYYDTIFFYFLRTSLVKLPIFCFRTQFVLKFLIYSHCRYSGPLIERKRGFKCRNDKCWCICEKSIVWKPVEIRWRLKYTRLEIQTYLHAEKLPLVSLKAQLSYQKCRTWMPLLVFSRNVSIDGGDIYSGS